MAIQKKRLNTLEERDHHLQSRLQELAGPFGEGSVAIYGAGRHTRHLLTRFAKLAPKVVFILDDDPTSSERTIAGAPVLDPKDASPAAARSVLVSSDASEEALAVRAREWAGRAPACERPAVLRIYEGCELTYLGSPASRAPRRVDARAETPRARPGFLILASPKSGTTWLQRMLCAHPQVHCIESRPWGNRYIPFAGDRYHVNTDHYARFLVDLMALPEGDRTQWAEDLADSLHSAVVDWTSQVTGKPIVGEKITPYEGDSVRAVECFFRADPDLPVIHLVRDPRDVVVSAFIHHTRAHPPADLNERLRYEAGVREEWAPDEAVRHWAGNWRDVAQGADLARRLFSRFVEVRYEDMVADGPGVLTRVLEHVGAERSARVVGECVAQASFHRLAGRGRGQEDRASFFRKGVPGDWVNWLTHEQERTVAEICGAPFLDRYGARADASNHAA